MGYLFRLALFYLELGVVRDRAGYEPIDDTKKVPTVYTRILARRSPSFKMLRQWFKGYMH